MSKKKKYNPEKRTWRGKSYKKGSSYKKRGTINKLRDKDAVKQDKKS